MPGPETLLDPTLQRGVLSALRRDPPPRYDDAMHAVGVVENSSAQWPQSQRAPSEEGQPPRSDSGQRSRSVSRGPPVKGALLAGNVAAVARRPPRPAHNDSPLLGAGQASLESRRAGSAERKAPLLGKRDGQDPLLGSMASRLAQVEQLNRQLSAAVAEKDKELARLRSMFEAQSSTQPAHAGEGGEDDQQLALAPAGHAGNSLLRAENIRLKAELEDIRHFLAEYGLTWVPRKSSDGTSECQEPESHPRPSLPRRPQGQKSTASAGASVDISVLEARVQSLNAIVEELASRPASAAAGGQSAASQIASCHSKKSGPVPVTFFADGIKAASRAFLPYEQKPAQDFLRDILDGFFPRALEGDYPDGVLLRVIDRTGHAFKDWWRGFAQQDPDLMDGGERLRPAAGHIVKSAKDEMSPAERIVAKLPERIIKGGRVCEVRSAVAQQVGLQRGPSPGPGKEPRESSLPPGAAAAPDSEVCLLDGNRDPNERPVARLRVALESSQRVHLCMEPLATIGDLMEALNKWRSGHKLQALDWSTSTLRTAFPPQSYQDRAQTLQAAGLVPNANLFVSAAPKPS